jgi:hypothetical protein
MAFALKPRSVVTVLLRMELLRLRVWGWGLADGSVLSCAPAFKKNRGRVSFRDEKRDPAGVGRARPSM